MQRLKKFIQNLLAQEVKPIVLKYKKLDPRAKEPTKANQSDAGLDLYALERAYIPAGQWRAVRTGLAFEIPEGWHLQVHTRSSYAKAMIRCHLGIIDAGYRNEVLVIVYNQGWEDFIVDVGAKFCQLLLLPVPNIILQEAESLTESERGQKGFGSSGK